MVGTEKQRRILKMELRTQIHAPRKLDDAADAARPDKAEEELRKRRNKDPKTTPYRLVEHVKFNPNLRAAAFPTIDSWAPKEIDTAIEPSSAEGLNLSPEDGSSQHLRNPLKSTTPIQSTPQTKSQQVSKPTSIPSSRKRSRRSHSVFSGSSDDASEVGEGVRSNGPRNPIYQRNMEILDKMQRRGDSDWDIAEMETSSEEEGSSKALSTLAQQANPEPDVCPDWDELPIPNRLDLIFALSEKCDGEQNAMSRLRLNLTQKQTMNEILARYKERLADEDTRREALQAEMNRILMADNSAKVRQVSQAKYRELFDKHLVRPEEENFHISTAEGLSKAKQYLQSCGFEPKILDPWTRGSLQVDGDAKGMAEVAPSESVTEQQEAAQLTHVTQSSRLGGSNIQDAIDRHSFRTSTEYDAMVPSPADTLRTPQTRNLPIQHSNEKGRIEMNGEPSSVNRGNNSEAALEREDHRRLNRRTRTPTSRKSRPQDRPRRFIEQSIGRESAATIPVQSESLQVPVPFPTLNVVSPVPDDFYSHTSNVAPSIQARSSSDPLLITPARLAHATGPPPRKSPLRLTVSRKDATTATPAAKVTNVQESHQPDTMSPHKKARRGTRIPTMLSALLSSPGYKSEVAESPSRSPRSSRVTTACPPLPQPRSEAQTKSLEKK